jgi:hypothetical protein
MHNNPYEGTPKEILFTENNSKIDETLQILIEKEQNPSIETDTQLDTTLMNNFTDANQASYNCHSFALALYENVFGEKLVNIPNFPKPFDPEKLNIILDSTAEGKNYTDAFHKWMLNYFQYSTHFDIPHRSILITEETYQKNRLYFQSLANGIVQDLREQDTSSRYLLLVYNDENLIEDLHSAIILGENYEGNDLWVLEKEQQGSDIQPKLLSKILERYSYGYVGFSKNFTVCVGKKAQNDSIDVE